MDEILKFASKDTKLPIKHPVKRELAGREQVRKFVQTHMQEDKDAQRLQRSEASMKKFGLLPRDFDLGKFLLDLLDDQVAGYYDPKTKTVYLLDWVSPEAQRPVLAHELTHALQDQNFDLDKWLKVRDDDQHDNPDNLDTGDDEEQAAGQAVSEGQGMAVMMDYVPDRAATAWPTRRARARSSSRTPWTASATHPSSPTLPCTCVRW